ncbi:uncharacterized protein LOC123498782 isoform X3 [Portunus trituberculatus]|uniref:uncharacterized protein LOC123498782 isoform X3 n=1 Tax=Portunus trituberculatus TaxID=210409 RepID=UPI001E1CCF3C|nr:uncharacterized protein LOC123498782 isoform X3 [Portunus trituberculatus]
MQHGPFVGAGWPAQWWHSPLQQLRVLWQSLSDSTDSDDIPLKRVYHNLDVYQRSFECATCHVLRAQHIQCDRKEKNRRKMRWWILALLLEVLAEARDVLSRYGDYGCYAEVGRGLRLAPDRVDRYVIADTLRDCKRACDQAFFACKSFSYSNNRRQENENCLLSREDSHSLNTNDFRDFFKDFDFDYYERSYSSRECDSDLNNIYYGGRTCYDLRRTNMRIDSRFIRRELRTRNRRECEMECDRQSYCRGFNYRFKTQGFNQYRNNCQLSYQDGSSDFDFHSDLDFDFYEKDYNSRNCHTDQGGGGGYYGGGRDECFRLVQEQRAISEREAAGSLNARDIRECESVCEQSWQFICKVFSFSSYYSSSGLRHNCLLSDTEYRDLPLYSLVNDRDSNLYERRLYDRECSLDIAGGSHYHHGEGQMTVSGLRCYRESCRLDRHGGYYLCETDHSGAWDYCCRPQEKCGHSEGYHQAWCYVGSTGHDQWRPCNENLVRGRDFLKNRLLDGAANNWTTTTETSPSTDYPASTVHPVELIDMF